ncbi:5-oxoprolinase subunit PxpB [Mucilaginibacter sp. UR6-11]|uniref:5-oxoprolinase subunit PxpB n=1 Tax=Mucilaginibacter sp. UR6-11 TaxID=1435644 RepID=UPI001E41B209|nr:5-oxoprolinase subunit PxpB [Mucilaginibacter sp. UR6-11]MCC8426517.1 5-oxoprolinase subunit PxpB [Mucilaginibacter sp. UR6-11]
MHSADTPDQTLRIYYLSEEAVTIEFGQVIDLHLLDRVSVLNMLLHQQPFAGFCTAVPAYATLTVFFDPLSVSRSDLPGKTCFEKVSGFLQNSNRLTKGEVHNAGNVITIPVCYDKNLGPDLEEVARLHKLSIEEVIHLHSAAVYKAYMIGFVPGFAYLGGMDDQLTTPRKATPRKAVPAGSVGIAGAQTGVYPMQTPGGWQIIGRTPVKLFDAGRSQPSLLQAGDQVIFKPVNRAEFNELVGE